MAKPTLLLKRRAARQHRRSCTILDGRIIDQGTDQPRARGKVALSTKLNNGTAIDHLRQEGSLKLLFPHNPSEGLDAVLLNTAGGITGGDRFGIDVTVAAGTALTMTTQAAERAYRAQGAEVGQLVTRIQVKENARFNWLPQETILFEGSALARQLDIILETGARALVAEPLVIGRHAMGESLRRSSFHDRITISFGPEPLFIDVTELTGDITGHLSKPSIANGATAMALIVFVAPEAEGHLEPVRALLPETAGASLIGDKLLVARILAADSFELRKSLIPVLARLNGAALPRCWMT